MPTTVAELTNDGDFKLAGNVNTRLPIITNGLIAHFPFDGTTGSTGTTDLMYSATSESYTNLAELHFLDWRDPANWTLTIGNSAGANLTWSETEQCLIADGYGWWYFNGLIYLDPSKNWYISADMKKSGPNGVTYFGTRLGLKKDKTNVATAHPGTWDYFGASGVTTPSTWTTYRNSGISGAARTGTSSDATYSTWDPETFWTQPSFIANYSSGVTGTDKLYIRNLNFYYTNANSSNITNSYDGVYVEESTTNLYSAKVNSPSDWLNSGTAPTINNNDNSVGRPLEIPSSVNIRSCLMTATANYHFGYEAVTISASTQYTLSIWYYQTAANTSTYYARNVDTNMGNMVWEGNGSSTPSTWPLNKWIRLYVTFTTAAGQTSVFASGYPNFSSYPNKVFITAPQLEQKAWMTAFTASSRAASYLTYPLIFSNNMTFIFDHFPTMPTSAQVDQGTSPNIFELGSYYSNASATLWSWTGSVKTYFKGDSGTGWQTIPTHGTLSAANWIKNHRWALVYSGTAGWDTYKVYLDGVLYGTSTSLSPVITTISNNFFGFGSYGGAYPNASYKNFSVYNRALSDTEIKELSTNTFELTSAGNLITSNINTKPTMPTDVYYFPLGFDTKDQYKMVNPSGSANISFNFGSAWVGEAATNVFVYPSFENAASNGGWSHWGAAGSNGAYGQSTDRSFIWYNVNSGYQTYAHWVTNASGATGDYLLYQEPALSAGSDRAVSAVIKMSDGSPVTNAKVYPAWNSRDSGSPNNAWISIEDIGGGFYLCKTPGIHQDGTNDLVGFYVKPGYTAYFSFCQLENTRYTSPFVNTSRARSYLYYTPSTMGITLASGDWTFGVFVKTDAIILASAGTRYNTIEIGQYYVSGSTSLTMFHETSANVFYGVVYEELTGRTAPGSITLNSADLAKILFVGFKKLGTTITMFCVSPTNGLQQTSITQSWTIALYDRVWVGGYNWSSGNYYCKDFIAAKRALTDAELDAIYKEKLDTKDMTRIQGSIQTVQTLT